MNITPQLTSLANFMSDNDLSSTRLYKSGRLKLRHNKTDLPHNIGTCQAIIDLQLSNGKLSKLSETTELKFKFTDPDTSFRSINEQQLIKLMAMMTAANAIPARIIDAVAVRQNINLVPAAKVIACWPTGKFPEKYIQLRYLHGPDVYFDKVELSKLVIAKKIKAKLLAL